MDQVAAIVYDEFKIAVDFMQAELGEFDDQDWAKVRNQQGGVRDAIADALGKWINNYGLAHGYLFNT